MDKNSALMLNFTIENIIIPAIIKIKKNVLKSFLMYSIAKHSS